MTGGFDDAMRQIENGALTLKDIALDPKLSLELAILRNEMNELRSAFVDADPDHAEAMRLLNESRMQHHRCRAARDYEREARQSETNRANSLNAENTRLKKELADKTQKLKWAHENIDLMRAAADEVGLTFHRVDSLECEKDGA